MVYLARKDGAVIHHTDLDAMKAMDGIAKAEMEISDEEFEAAGCLARIIDGKIFIGKTDAEKRSDADAERIALLKAKLSETDYIAYKLAEVSDDADAYSAMKERYAQALSEREAWREEIGELEDRAA